MPTDLSVFDGLRCVACLRIVLVHVHFFHSGVYFLSSDPSCTVDKNNYVNVARSFQMTLFWCLSGFLHEHQLTVASSGGSPPKQISWFPHEQVAKLAYIHSTIYVHS
mgnify:CR=1 FL=1